MPENHIMQYQSKEAVHQSLFESLWDVLAQFDQIGTWRNDEVYRLGDLIAFHYGTGSKQRSISQIDSDENILWMVTLNSMSGVFFSKPSDVKNFMETCQRLID